MSKILGDRYEVMERIGADGMSIVYKAKDLLLNRIVIIKMLREQFIADEEFIRSFRHEALTVAGFSHPNIISIYDVGREGETDYSVMEYVEGRNLKDVIRNYAPLAPDQALHLVRQIAEAISHIHKHHIIHGNIKPHNILVTSDWHAKVTNFGLARVDTAATVKQTSGIVGSIHYLSPEQARGVQSNEQSDLYSLGIILYELVTGKVPYNGETPVAIALKHLKEHSIAPGKLNPKISLSVETLIMRSIAKNPKHRYPTAKEFLQDLNKIQTRKKSSDIEATQIHKGLPPRTLSKYGTELPPVSSENLLQAWISKAKSNRKFWLGLGIVLTVFLVFGGVFLWLYNYVNGKEIAVPSLTGKTITEATGLLNQSRLQLSKNVNHEPNETVPKDDIIRQTPAENSMVKEGREVQVWVSSGPTMLTMPDFHPQPSHQASKAAFFWKAEN